MLCKRPIFPLFILFLFFGGSLLRVMGPFIGVVFAFVILFWILPSFRSGNSSCATPFDMGQGEKRKRSPRDFGLEDKAKNGYIRTGDGEYLEVVDEPRRV